MGYALMVVGGAILVAVVLNLKIITSGDRFGFLSSALGDTGWRIMLGVLGAILLGMGVDLTWHVF